MTNPNLEGEIKVTLPLWLRETLEESPRLNNQVDRMRFVLGLAQENRRQNTGGPFASAVFEVGSGLLLGAGVNLVQVTNVFVAHSNLIALMKVSEVLGMHDLASSDLELVTSCEPCGMCSLGALFAGIKSIVYSADNRDALRCGFERGPVHQVEEHLTRCGVTLRGGVCSKEGKELLRQYKEHSGAYAPDRSS